MLCSRHSAASPPTRWPSTRNLLHSQQYTEWRLWLFLSVICFILCRKLAHTYSDTFFGPSALLFRKSHSESLLVQIVFFFLFVAHAHRHTRVCFTHRQFDFPTPPPPHLCSPEASLARWGGQVWPREQGDGWWLMSLRLLHCSCVHVTPWTI